MAEIRDPPTQQAFDFFYQGYNMLLSTSNTHIEASFPEKGIEPSGQTATPRVTVRRPQRYHLSLCCSIFCKGYFSDQHLKRYGLLA